MNFNELRSGVVEMLGNDLSPKLHYHNLNHTVSVIKSATTIAQSEGVNETDLVLVRTAALLHDIGFLWDFDNHEAVGAEYVFELLPNYGYEPADIEHISAMIKATKIPQSPKSKLAEILCDADLAYLGSDYFYTIGNLLFKELIEREIVENAAQWDKMQIEFLTSHSYYTTYAQKNLKPKKDRYLTELIQGQSN